MLLQSDLAILILHKRCLSFTYWMFEYCLSTCTLFATKIDDALNENTCWMTGVIQGSFEITCTTEYHRTGFYGNGSLGHKDVLIRRHELAATLACVTNTVSAVCSIICMRRLTTIQGRVILLPLVSVGRSSWRISRWLGASSGTAQSVSGFHVTPSWSKRHIVIHTTVQVSHWLCT